MNERKKEERDKNNKTMDEKKIIFVQAGSIPRAHRERIFLFKKEQKAMDPPTPKSHLIYDLLITCSNSESSQMRC